ncbi:uncharacterized protein [Ptychodera flava]
MSSHYYGRNYTLSGAMMTMVVVTLLFICAGYFGQQTPLYAPPTPKDYHASLSTDNRELQTTAFDSGGNRVSTRSSVEVKLMKVFKSATSRIRRNMTMWMEELKMTPLMVSKAFKHPSSTSTSAFSRVIIDAVMKERPLKMGVAGGSISAGRKIYASFFADTMKSALGVPVEIHNGAIGGTDSRFGTYCFGALVNMTELDIVLWEYAVNDYLKGVGPWAQEEFSRTILDLPNSPQLIYVNFLHGVTMHRNSCESNEINGSRPLSEHYNVPSIRTADAICNIVKYGNFTDLVMSRRNGHPSPKYHKMTGVFLVEFFARVLDNLLSTLTLKPIEDVKHLYVSSPKARNLKPIFTKVPILKPKCWTVLGNTRRGLARRLLTPIDFDGWKLAVADSEKPNRTDLKRFWESGRANSSIIFPVNVPPLGNLNCTVAISLWGCPECGSADVFIDGDRASSVRVSSKYKWKATTSARVSGNLVAGNHTMTLIGIGDGNFRISSIMTSYRTDL